MEGGNEREKEGSKGRKGKEGGRKQERKATWKQRINAGRNIHVEACYRWFAFPCGMDFR